MLKYNSITGIDLELEVRASTLEDIRSDKMISRTSSIGRAYVYDLIFNPIAM